ncbi:MAG: YidC/Oxa1 family membrane protein insertase [Flavobacteriales bacterium]|jgi:YidC/Oxa1 family membrane protein insertase
MNWLRYSLFAAIFAVVYLLFLEWNKFDERNDVQIPAPLAGAPVQSIDNPVVISTTTAPSLDGELPSVVVPQNTTDQILPGVIAVTSQQYIEVHTDTFNVTIDTNGGDIIRTTLPQYLAKIDKEGSAFTLLDRTNAQTFVAQSGLLGPNGTDAAGVRPRFSSEQVVYELDDESNTLSVDLYLDTQDAKIIKRFTFNRDSYLINIDYIVENISDKTWQATLYGQMLRNDFKVEGGGGIGMKPFLGAAITTPEKNYEKLSLDDIDDKDCGFFNAEGQACKLQHTGGWIAMVQHYFVNAWIPQADEMNNYRMDKIASKGLYILEYHGPFKKIAPGQSGTLSTSFYSGPKIIKNLEGISPHLDLTIDFSWLWFIAKPLHIALLFIQSFVGNWGVAIILLTLCIKVVFFYPSAISYRSMAKMRKVQPLMAELKERMGDDKQKMQVELMKLYKTEKVNPFGGCLPILMQMPVFIALYWSLMESVELRHAPFFLWITDLSVKDPFYLLPLLMGATMFIQQKLNPTPPDPMQAKVMQMMPIFFTALFLFFPSGLVLYWVVNNTLSITQQYIITRQIEKAD